MRAADLRASGAEFLTIPDDLPTRAEPGDVGVALEGYFTAFEGSIGLLDPLDRRIQLNRGLLEPVLDQLKADGRAFVTYEQGLDTARQAADRRDVPAALVYRVLDREREGAPRIRRYLDRAAFEANRRGEIVILAHDYPDTLEALRNWTEDQAELYEFVPVSNLLIGEN